MYEVGRICVKLAGRDAGLKCVVVDVVDERTVLIDGQTRRRKCNVKHLEPLKQIIKLKKNASRKDVFAEFKKLKIETRETNPKKASERPRRLKSEKTKLTEIELKPEKKEKVEEKKKVSSEKKKEAKKPKASKSAKKSKK